MSVILSKRKCQHIIADHARAFQCNRPPGPTGLCNLHTPEAIEQRQEAKRRKFEASLAHEDKLTRLEKRYYEMLSLLTHLAAWVEKHGNVQCKPDVQYNLSPLKKLLGEPFNDPRT